MTYINIETGLKGGRSPVVGRDKLLSDDEVEQALIEEAKRRGFVDGAHINPIEGDDDFKPYYRSKFGHEYVFSKLYEYNPDADELSVYGYGRHVIYRQGNWAEIIEDEWRVEREMNPNYFRVVNRDLREINVYVGESLSKKEAEAIATALNELD